MSFLEAYKDKALNIINRFLKRRDISFGFLKNSLFQRLAIAISLCLILAIIMAPDINLSSEQQFKLGMIAPRNIKADHSFLVQDQQATEQKKLEDAENVKPIYDYDGKTAENLKTKLTKAFSSVIEEQQNSFKGKTPGNNNIDISKLQKDKKLLEENLGIYLSAEEFYVLNEYKFSEELQQKFSRLISSFYENKFITDDVLVKQKNIIVRNLRTKIEEEVQDSSLLFNIQEIDKPLLKSVNMIFRGDKENLKAIVFSVTKKLIEPNLIFNKDATEKKRLAVMEDTNTTFFRVQKNEMIVREIGRAHV
jgi:cyclic-di-AMP phosphodiesterase PgpH